ncbi:phosphopantetheine attachment site protein [filamentous cyanobacterium CCT1]|nr:phosphopantetheine attachment site protein [filamentous cyanobacterium CCT1]PSN79724.1 phosphopantetheine attachment site protein [filamentous cyanobacterium CCP4]
MSYTVNELTVDEIRQKIQAVLLNVLPDVSPSDLSDDVDIFTLGLDSINAMTLIFNLQESFGIEFDTSEINFENFQTIQDMIRLVSSKQG